MIDDAGLGLWTKILELIVVICQSMRMYFFKNLKSFSSE